MMCRVMFGLVGLASSCAAGQTVGFSGSAQGVSADGTVVVGYAGNGPDQAVPFMWTPAGGYVSLDTVSGKSSARAASANGSVIVGNMRGKPFVWTAGTGAQTISALDGAAMSVSADGTIVVGYLGTNPSSATAAFRWTAATGLQQISTPGYVGTPFAAAISGDGSVIAIGGTIPGTGAIRVTSGGITDVPRLSGSSGYLVTPTGLSYDGSVMGGYQELGSGGNRSPFRWVFGSNPTNLGLVTGTDEATVTAISTDGTTVVGYADQHHTGLALTPFVWKQSGGIQSLTSFLAGTGTMVPDGSLLRMCYGVSGTGLVIVGLGNVAGFDAGSFRVQTCYANCDGSTSVPLLTANDFQCFLNRFAAGDTGANCDGSTSVPILSANDFQCFLNKYAAGCS